MNRGARMNDHDRIYQDQDGRWYFNLRGNQRKGPFQSHVEAAEQLEKIVQGHGAGRFTLPKRAWKARSWHRRSIPHHS